MNKSILLLIAGMLSIGSLFAQNPDGTYLYARKDTASLFMDVYSPTPRSEVTFEGHHKPTVLFLFGGGFIKGERSARYWLPWFKVLNDNGYRVITLDYRLGLKGVRMKFGLFDLKASARALKKAVEMGVEDAFSAISFISDNAGALGVDPGNIVIAGSSAGAMIALSCELEIRNKGPRTGMLPEGFRFAGLISFAGGIISDSGKVRYESEPCPQLFIHGTMDKTVPYRQIKFGRWGLFGADKLAERLSVAGYAHNIYRYEGHDHDMAGHLVPTWPEQRVFLESNVMSGSRRTVDATVNAPSLPKRKSGTMKSLYK